MNSKISVIVPVYNVKPYLERCVESLLGQTYRNLEVVLVDDRSTDGSGELCDGLARWDARVKVIHNAENIGAGMSRNAGLEAATGDYISAMDSDDYTDPETYETAVSLAQENDLDLLRWDYNYFEAEGKFTREIEEGPLRIFSTDEELRCLYLNCISDRRLGGFPNLGVGPWYLAKAEIMKGVTYPSERVTACEDIVFALDQLGTAKRVGYLPKTFYHYRVTSGSITHSTSTRFFDRAVELHKELMARYDNPRLGETGLRNVAECVFKMLIGQMKAALDNPAVAARREWLEALKDHELMERLAEHFPFPGVPVQQRLLFRALRRGSYEGAVLLHNLRKLKG